MLISGTVIVTIAKVAAAAAAAEVAKKLMED